MLNSKLKKIMINIKSIYLLVLTAMMLTFSSCKDYFGDVNVDPNNPTVVTPSVLLPTIETRLAYLVGGDASRYSSIMTQHIAGTGRQFVVIQNYGLRGADVNPMWGQNIYAGILQDIKQLKMLTTDNSPHYMGIAQVLEAYTVMLTTDLFGAIPYSEALQGTSQLQPKFDTQQEVYTALQALLDKAIANFALSSPLAAGSDDLIYGGDATKWTKFAYALKARGYLHLGLTGGSNYTSALTNLANGFADASDDSRLPFGAEATANAPWYQYNQQRTDCDSNTTYVQTLRTLNDPRLSVFGLTLDDTHPYFTATQAQPLMTYTEMKFIEAECRMQTEGATAATHQAYLDAIASSLSDVNLSGDYATYVGQSSVDPGSANLTMNHIMTQKYIAMYTDVEAYTDWRRTGIPALTPNTGTEIPTRFPYPEDEVRYNSNCPKDVTIFEKVWWDM